MYSPTYHVQDDEPGKTSKPPNATTPRLNLIWPAWNARSWSVSSSPCKTRMH